MGKIIQNIYFNAKELALITGGEWIGLESEGSGNSGGGGSGAGGDSSSFGNFSFNKVEYIYKFLEKGDLFVVYYDNWSHKTKNNEEKIEKAIKKGVAAIMVQKGFSQKVAVPVLVVDDTYLALRAIAKATSKKTECKKVLVTGSYGKTGFKNHLGHISQDSFCVYYRNNSANYTPSLYCNLASIGAKTELFIAEIPVSRKNKMQRRSKIVAPDICVITSIGHESIHRFKTIEEIVKNKCAIAEGLRDGGKIIIPKNSKYSDLIFKELKIIQKYKNFEILTFDQNDNGDGNDSDNNGCNARILYKKYENFKWNIIAKIEDKIIAYTIPFFETYAPNASLAEFLALYHLGGDLHLAASKYFECENYKSSGNFYKIIIKNYNLDSAQNYSAQNYKNQKSFYFYDQSNRGGVEGYGEFFRSVANLKTKEGGKKILLTSGFVDFKDGEMEFLDRGYFWDLIQKSGIESFYTVEDFDKQEDILRDKKIWKRHSKIAVEIFEEVLETINDGDILLVKGIFESKLYKFIDFLKEKKVNFELIHPENDFANKNRAFEELRVIKIEDMQTFKNFVQLANAKGWIYYFPFLYFWSLSKNREILFAQKFGSLSIFLLRNFQGEGEPNFYLYAPPLPISKESLGWAIKIVDLYKGRGRAEIVWVDQEMVGAIKKIEKGAKFKFRGAEFLYSPEKYVDISGGFLKNIRKQVSRVKKLDPKVVLFEKKYEKECLGILKEWNVAQGVKYKKIGDLKYTRATIKNAHLFEPPDLFGIVVLIGGKVKSFAFMGKMCEKIGNGYIVKSDHSIKGLNTFTIREIFLLLEKYNCHIVNNGETVSEGMKMNKKLLRPAKLHKTYRARIGW